MSPTDVWESAVTTATYTVEITLPARGAGPHLTEAEVHNALEEISDVLAEIRVERTGIETGNVKKD